MTTPTYKFDEESYLDEMHQYIQETYAQHYANFVNMAK